MEATTHSQTSLSATPRTARARNLIRPAAGVTYDKPGQLLRFDDTADPTIVDEARLSLCGTASTPGSQTAMQQLRELLPETSAAKLRNYVPELPVEDAVTIRSFVEDAVILTLPTTSYTVETLLRSAMHFVYWAVFVVGAELDAQIVFTRKLIEHYVRETMPELTEGTRRNYRAWLFRVAEVANPEANPNNPLPLSDRALESPYSTDDEDALDRWAAGQPTKYLRTNAAVLLALGCGLGLNASEIVLVRGEDITVDENGAVHVNVSGKASRMVVARTRYEKTLKRAVGTVAPGAFVFLPKRTRTGHDVVSAFVGRTDNSAGTPVVRARKMRNTWLVRHLSNRVDVTTLMKAAGLQSLESISRLAQFVPSIDEVDRVNMLRGRR